MRHRRLTSAALLIMVGYAAAHGGRDETLSLLQRAAQQVRSLGLDKRDIAHDFNKDQVDRSLFNHIYMDT